MGYSARFFGKGWNIEPVLMQFDEHFDGAFSISEAQNLCRRFSNLHLQYSLLRRAAEYGSSLIASIRTSLTELLYRAQRHNKIRQGLGMRSDKCSKNVQKSVQLFSSKPVLGSSSLTNPT